MITYDSPTTVGQQAEINARRVGKEQMQLMAEESKTRFSSFTGKLPDGASPLKTAPETPWFRDGSVPGLAKLDKPLDVSKLKDVRAYVEKGVTP